MITRNELINSKEYWLVKFQNSLFEEVERYLSENNMTKTDFAKKLGVSKGYISQILNGDFDHKISKLVELSLAIGKAPLLEFENLEKHISNPSESKRAGRKAKMRVSAPSKKSVSKMPASRKEKMR